jgi:hypothetical protein
MLEGKELVWSLCFGHFYISLMVDPVWQKILSPVQESTIGWGWTCIESRYTIF